MLRVLFFAFLITMVLPSVIYTIFGYFYQKKCARKAAARKPALHFIDEQMAGLLQPDGKINTAIQTEEEPAKDDSENLAEAPIEKPVMIIKEPPHEVQTIILKREIYY